MSSAWLNNAMEYLKTGKVGTCPKCGSAAVEVKQMNYGRSSKTFSCRDCKSFAHFDEVKTAES